MTLKVYTLGLLKNNCYIVIDDFNKLCAIIDAPKPAEEVIKYVKENNLEVKYILLTHNHFDHTGGLPMLQEAFPNVQVAQSSVSIGEIDIQAIKTPGHTPDSVSYYISHEHTLFSGDTLFFESIGRTDFKGGNLKEELSSINTKLFALPPQTKVYPGHGKPTTIEWEMKHNPYLTIEGA